MNPNKAPSISSNFSNFSKIATGITKTNSSSDESGSRRRGRRNPRKDIRIDLDKLRKIESISEQNYQAKMLLLRQDELIKIEDRKQEGLQKLKDSVIPPTTNKEDIDREYRNSRLTNEELKYNIRKLKV